MNGTVSFEYELTDGTIERAAALAERRIAGGMWTKFWRAIPFLAIPAAVAGTLWLWLRDMAGPNDDIAGPIGIAAAILAAAAGLMTAAQLTVAGTARLVRRYTRRQLLAWAANLGDRRIRWTFTADGFTTLAGTRERSQTWDEVQSCDCCGDFAVLLLRDRTELFLPLDLLPAELWQAIQSRVAGTSD
jgi:hypothetical protein